MRLVLSPVADLRYVKASTVTAAGEPVELRFATRSEVFLLAEQVAAGGLSGPESKHPYLADWSMRDDEALAWYILMNSSDMLLNLDNVENVDSEWIAPFTVFYYGLPVGRQTLYRRPGIPSRCARSGSWLLEPYRAKGIGKAARRCVLAVMYHAGVVVAQTEWSVINTASESVARSLGYEYGEIIEKKQYGEVIQKQQAHIDLDAARQNGLFDNVIIEPIVRLWK